jgi:hypothetical protein
LWTATIGTTASILVIFIRISPPPGRLPLHLPAQKRDPSEPRIVEKVPLFREAEAKSLHLAWKNAFAINTMEWLSHQQRSEESLWLQKRKLRKARKGRAAGKANAVSTRLW